MKNNLCVARSRTISCSSLIDDSPAGTLSQLAPHNPRQNCRDEHGNTDSPLVSRVVTRTQNRVESQIAEEGRSDNKEGDEESPPAPDNHHSDPLLVCYDVNRCVEIRKWKD